MKTLLIISSIVMVIIILWIIFKPRTNEVIQSILPETLRTEKAEPERRVNQIVETPDDWSKCQNMRLARPPEGQKYICNNGNPTLVSI